jgi:starch-binding outer membrane protein, SusD/RagB family
MNTTTRSTLAVAAALLLGTAACTDITTEPTSTVTGSNIFNDPASYRAFLAKLYGGLQVTGQQGPAGSGDIEGIDEGFSHYLRQLWQLQELPTDEAVIGWGDAGLPELNTMQWGAGNQFLGAMYYRVFYQVTLANEFLRETTDQKLAQRNVTPALAAQIRQYRAEARFLRALSYWHGIDLFGDIPLVTEADGIGATPPEQSTRQEIFDYVVGELAALSADLPAYGQAQYGRADRGAAQMLLAKLYLNAQVYTGQPRWAEARAAAEAVIASGAYQLDPVYRDLFLADNHTSPEIIFPVPFDGRFTRTWGGMTFLTHAAVGGNMNAGEYGLDGGWWGLRATPEFVGLFPGGAGGGADRRSGHFFSAGQTMSIADLGNFNHGIATPKFQNVTSGGAPGSNLTFPDTDYPMFRLADAYLMYAEAVLRGGGGSEAAALGYFNALRQRAYGDDSGNVAALSLELILDERARELHWEGHRRTDLVRFGRFTSGAQLWAWKGGTQAGRAVEACKALYPLPASELQANPNLEQRGGC